jgi:hypothetical protein
VSCNAAWAGVCPGNNQSCGKRNPAVARNGNAHLKTVLCNAEISAAHQSGSFFKANYHSLKARRGAGRAALAIAHTLLVCIHHILSNGTPYHELSENHAAQRDRQRLHPQTPRHRFQRQPARPGRSHSLVTAPLSAIVFMAG